MVSYATALRAVASLYAQRLIRRAGLIGAALFVLLIVATWLLAHYVSSYWWLSLSFILPLGLIGLAVFMVLWWLSGLLYRRKLTASTQRLVTGYLDTVQSVVEATQFSFVFILLIIGKDLVLHRDLRTLEKFIGDSRSLKSNLDELRSKL